MTDVDGLLGSPRIPVAKAAVPDVVRLIPSEEALWWAVKREGSLTTNSLHAPISSRRDSHGMLDSFLQIKTPKDVLSFAERFGVLGLCEQGLPASHDGECMPRRVPGGTEGQTSLEVYWEPVNRWLELVKATDATLLLSAALYDGGTGQEADWVAAWHGLEPRMPGDLVEFLARKACEGVDLARALLSALVYTWLDIGDVRMYVRWEGPKAELQLTASWRVPPAFGILGSQLALAVARASELAVCTGCLRLYLREGRRPQKGRRNYCKQCRDPGVPAKDRQRARRACQACHFRREGRSG